MRKLTRTQELEADIDLRQWDLIGELAYWDLEDESLKIILAFMRAAYALGYMDAWEEIRPASLFRDHGYQVPVRAQATLAELEA